MTRRETKIRAYVIRSGQFSQYAGSENPAHRANAEEEFAFTYLASPEFDVETLQQIRRALKLPSANNKSQLAKLIASECRVSERARSAVISNLITRRKKWAMILKGCDIVKPTLHPPTRLAVEVGSQEWYGPIELDEQDVSWYVRPTLVKHWEITSTEVEFGSTDDKEAQIPTCSQIRWLCFARVEGNFVTLHWQNFTHVEEIENLEKPTVQFPYWQYIPSYAIELGKLLKSNFEPINLHEIVLQTLWERCRADTAHYIWKDQRIRAESGGVALAARSAKQKAVELDVKGIGKLAQTLRSAVQHELASKYDFDIPAPLELDEVILQTMIRDLGALSYEFSLETHDGDPLFHGHCYFGAKPSQASPDGFPHVNFYTSFRPDLDQLRFLLDSAVSKNGTDNHPSKQVVS